MTWFLASLSCKIPGISSHKNLQTCFPLKNDLLIMNNHEISAVENLLVSQYTIKEHWTDLLQLAGQWEMSATGSQMQRDSSWVEHASWLLIIPFWLEANYIFLRTSTSFCNHLPLLFQNRKSWLQKRFSMARVDPKQADQWALDPMWDWQVHSNNVDTS